VVPSQEPPSKKQQQLSGTIGPLVKRALPVLVIAAVFAGPRLVALRGAPVSSMFHFEDMPLHQLLLDKLIKRHSLPQQHLEAPFLQDRPELMKLTRPPHWPLGVHLAAAPWALLFGAGATWTTQLTNLLFSVLLLCGVYGLGRRLGDRRLGFFAALACALCPPLVASSLYLSLDYPLVAMTTVGLLLLLWTDRFSRLSGCLAFAAWSALGMFVKPTYAFYLLGPCAWVLISGLLQAGHRRRALIHVGASLFLSALLTVLLINPDWTLLREDFSRHMLSDDLPAAKQVAWTWSWLTINAMFVLANLPFPLLLLALPGLALAHRRGAGAAERLLPVFLWSTYVVLTLSENKMERYVQPLYPVLCLLSVYLASRLAPRRWRAAALWGVVVAFGAMLWVTHEHPTPWIEDKSSGTRQALDRDLATDGFHPLYYELHMPGRQRLHSLRRNRFDPECQLGPMVGQIKAWAAPHPGKPVVLSCLNNETETMPHDLLMKLVPGVLQQLRDRVVLVPKQICTTEPFSKALSRAPVHIVLLEQSVGLRDLPPGAVVARLRSRFRCGEKTHTVTMALMRGHRAAPAPGASGAIVKPGESR